MVVGAIGVAEENGVLWFGTQVNQTELAPEIVVASQVYHWEVILREIIADIQAGTPGGGESYAITLANGGQVIEFNEGYEIPEDIQEQLRGIVEGVATGEITIDLPE
jgi:basic membrane protein A